MPTASTVSTVHSPLGEKLHRYDSINRGVVLILSASDATATASVI
jgi:hypothetical protein